jgi:hypothetical protein
MNKSQKSKIFGNLKIASSSKAMTLQAILGFVLVSVALVLLLWWFFSPGEGLAGKIEALTPDTDILDTEKKAEQPDIEIPDESKTALQTIKQALEKASKSTDSKCIITHDEFPDFEDFPIVLSTIEEGIFIYISDGKGGVFEESVIPDIKPCIVAGADAAKNFYDNYFGAKQNKQPEFTNVKLAAITDKETLVADGTTYDLEDEDCCGPRKVNVLYKADNESICFFTTNDVINANEKGIDDDLIQEILGKIKPCEVTG